MSSKIEKAALEFKSGKNCSQAILCAFAEETGITNEDAMSIAAPLGGGKKIKCGAVLAAEIILCNPGSIKDKDDLYNNSEKIAEFENRFKEKNTSIICKELKAGLRSCMGCVKDSVAILEDMI